MDAVKQEMFEQAKAQGLEAGIVPVSNPPDEEQRLDELKRLGLVEKDFESDRRFNNVTQIASYLTECPVSVINILSNDSQFCKLSSGVDVETKERLKQTPRDTSICQYVLATPGEQLIIEDIDEDERTRNFQNMPSASGIRFYAGTPLVSSRGYALGTLCVVDFEPSKLVHGQKEGLRLLSDQVVTLLEQGDVTAGRVAGENDSEADTGTDAKGEYFSSASIMFTDFVGFTRLVEKIQPGELLDTLNTFFKGFDQITAKHRLKKVKTIGDAYMCVGGVPEGRPTHIRDTCAAALDLVQFVEGSNIQHRTLGKPEWPIRVGIHTGPVIAGYSGGTFDVWGDAVNIAARMEASGEAGRVHISEASRAFLDSAADVVERGQTDLKNKGAMTTFFLQKLT